ncbi:phosphoglucomutase [Pseudomonas putida]|uniref:hypothetical protein n=1 Tax=Pseudomonas putida TaxID=303 RepID=UPI000E0221DB|nr:hypothetical protein [Pseudomonas putida]SUD71116.1 phosphoglucomutase [Pseudomonas putida]
MTLSPLAGKPAPASVLVDIPRLLTAYYTGRPDAAVAAQRVAFGTSGHRGTSLELSFNEYHVLAITQAICLYRQEKGIDGPLFIGADTHALSAPATASALEVLAANGVQVMLSKDDEYTPTRPCPMPSSAITVAASRAWPTASSSPHRTTRRKAVGSSTTRPMAALQTAT